VLTLLHKPVAWSSQTQTMTTITTFRIDLMLDAMGRYRLIRCNATPTMISTMTIFSNGILNFLRIGKGNSRSILRKSQPRSNSASLVAAGVGNPGWDETLTGQAAFAVAYTKKGTIPVSCGARNRIEENPVLND
jgi:hypothetical protein